MSRMSYKTRLEKLEQHQDDEVRITVTDWVDTGLSLEEKLKLEKANPHIIYVFDRTGF